MTMSIVAIFYGRTNRFYGSNGRFVFSVCGRTVLKILVSWSLFKPQTRSETNVGVFTPFAHDKRRFEKFNPNESNGP